MPAYPLWTPSLELECRQNLVEGEGFEPSKLSRQIYSLLPLATREPLQLAAYFTAFCSVVKSLFFKLS